MDELNNSSPITKSVPQVTSRDLPDLTIHGYQVCEKLSEHKNQGKSGYLAKDIKLDRLVVIKEYHAPSSDYAHYLPEIERLQQLNHLNLPRYLNSFAIPTGFCVVREYQQGVSLAELEELPVAEIKLVADAVLKILKHLHQLQPILVHQNIKPENIIINTEAKLMIYLVDFGLRTSGETANTGTPGFIPPEQLFNLDLTPASDIYSLGVSLICLLTGTSTSQAQQLFDDRYCLQFQHLLPANTDPQLIIWLETMVEPNRYQRYFNTASGENHNPTINQVPEHTTRSPGFKLPAPKKKFKWLRWVLVLGGLWGLGLLARQFLFTDSEVEELSPAQIAKNQSIAQKAEFDASDLGKLIKEKRCINCSLNYQNFAKAELTGAIVPQSSFTGTNFAGANLTLAIFRDADLSGADLSKATLHQAAFYGARLIGTNLAGADLRNAKLVYAKLKGSSLEGANLPRADLKFAEFQQANLTNANLTDADLSNADMSYANLTGVVLTGAKLDGVNFTGATMPNGSIHP
jgi:uncharacterized protein YjbI with pentapeptide repeats